MVFEGAVNKLADRPKKLFLIDGLGAILSAFLLGVVLVKFESYFGIPKSTLYFLAAFPCVFAVYDLFCFLKVKTNSGSYIKAIAIANLVYVFLSIGFAFFHFQKLTYLGWSCIAFEILVLIFIVLLEFQTALKLNTKIY